MNNNLPTDPTNINQPTQGVATIEQSPQVANQVPVEQAPIKKQAPNMGGLPQWKNVLRDRRFKDANSGGRNKFREQWLNTVIDLNQHMGKEEQRHLRSQVYTINPDDYPLGEWNKTWLEATHAKYAAKGLEPLGGIPEEIKLPTDIGGEGKAVKKIVPSERIGVTKFEKALGNILGRASKVIEKVHKYTTPYLIGQDVVNTEKMATILETAHEATKASYGVYPKAFKMQWHEAVKLIDQTLAFPDFVLGGFKGEIAKEKAKAKSEGRHKYYRELPTDSRLKKIRDVIHNPDEYSELTDDVKDVILKEMLPAGLSVEEIDKEIHQAIKDKRLPEVGFYYGMGKNLEGWKAIKSPLAVVAQGLIGLPGFNYKAAGDAFWRGIVRDDEERKHVDPSAVRRELKGKTYEEQYGLIKGTLANMGLYLLADPLLWADLGSTRVKHFVKAGVKMLSGEAGLKETKYTVETLLKAAKDKSRYVEHKELVGTMEKLLSDKLFQTSMKQMDKASKLVNKVPPAGAMKAITEGTAGTKIPALLTKHFSRAEDLITDVHKITQLDEAGKLKNIEAVKVPGELAKARAIPMPGEAPIPMPGDIPRHIMGDVERAVSGRGITPAPGRAELMAPRIVGELGEASVFEQTLNRGAQRGLPRVNKEGTSIIDDTATQLDRMESEAITGVAETEARFGKKTGEVLAAEERRLERIGGTPDEIVGALEQFRTDTNKARVEELSRGVEGMKTYLKGTDVTDVSTEALEAFRATGGKVKKIPEGVGKPVKDIATGKIEKELLLDPMHAASDKTLTQCGIKMEEHVGPILTSGSLRRGAKYPGEVHDTIVGAFGQYRKIKAEGKLSGGRKLTKKEMGELDRTIEKLSKEWETYQEAVTAGTGRPPLTNIEKSLRSLDDNVKRLQGSTRGTFAIKRTSDPGVTKIYKKYGTTWKVIGEHTENPNGEYLGSVFGCAQKFFDERAARRALGKTIGQEMTSFEGELKKSYISIEKQFQHFPMVGKAVKNIYSVMDAVQERGLWHMKNVSGQSLARRWSKLTKEDMIDVPLLFEDAKLWEKLPATEKARLQNAMDKFGDFTKEFKAGYANRGVSVDFKNNIRNKWIEDNRAIQHLIQMMKDGSKKYIGKRDLSSAGIHFTPEGFNPKNLGQVKRLLTDNFFQNEAMVKELKNFEYVHIPYGQWFESGYDKAAMVKAMKVANAQGRKTFRIADLVETKAIDRSQVNIMDIMASYTQRAAKDFAMLDVKNAMKKSNLLLDMRAMAGLEKGVLKKAITEAKSKGWERVDPRHFPMYSKTMLHPAMKEWLYHFKHERLNANMFDRGMSHVKVWQFANPFFLPYYDLMQGLVARGPLINPVGMGKDLIWAMKMMKNRPPLYYEIMHAGMQSKPMALPFSQWTKQVNHLKTTNAGSYLTHLAKDNWKIYEPIYQASWNTAWGLDFLNRLMTTRFAMKKGMSTFDAAQFSALIHSDYANVPVKIRRNMNRVLFTPTFKITMFRLYKEMMKNMLKVPLKKMTGRGAELSIQEKQLAKAGLTTVLGAMVGMDLFMQHHGYIRDQFARRYYKNIRDEKGQMKEDVIVFASPLNMAPKYAYKLRDLAKENYRDSKTMQAIDTFKWDIHPVWRIMNDLAQNRKDNGDQIWEPFGDSEPLKYAKMAEYSISSAMAILKHIGLKDEPDDQQEAWELYRKDMGQMFATLSSPTTFAYLRDPKIIRYKKKLDRTTREWKRSMKDAIKEQRWNPSMAVNGQRKVLKQSQDLIRAIKEAEKRNDHATWQSWKQPKQ